MKKTIYTKQAKLIAKKLQEVRLKAGLTTRELSKRLGKGHSFISNCERGERRVDLAEFYWVCEICGASPKKVLLELLKDFSQ